MREIGRFPLLTLQQEIELAGKIKKGDAEARERMINSNLRLVVTIAHDYANLGLPLLDLISEGNIGLTKAVERFDPGKGAKLSTYAMWWIKQSIKRALANQGKTIRLPVHLVDKIARVRRVSLQMSDELGHEPTDPTGFRPCQPRTRMYHPGHSVKIVSQALQDLVSLWFC
jgi:RNA polymerase primary sigma factor